MRDAIMADEAKRKRRTWTQQEIAELVSASFAGKAEAIHIEGRTQEEIMAKLMELDLVTLLKEEREAIVAAVQVIDQSGTLGKRFAKSLLKSVL
jgi:poly-gamma-glutamate capsule biosynthesis protein CapA/YwtB (metallophosphatase superfamily)